MRLIYPYGGGGGGPPSDPAAITSIDVRISTETSARSAADSSLTVLCSSLTVADSSLTVADSVNAATASAASSSLTVLASANAATASAASSSLTVLVSTNKSLASAADSSLTVVDSTNAATASTASSSLTVLASTNKSLASAADSSLAVAISAISIPPGDIQVIETTASTSSYGTSGRKYLILPHGSTTTASFQITFARAGTFGLNLAFAMSSASSANARLRVDKKKTADGDDPNAALTTGTAFTLAIANDVNRKTLSNGSSSDLTFSNVSVGDEFRVDVIRLGGDGADSHTGDMRVTTWWIG